MYNPKFIPKSLPNPKFNFQSQGLSNNPKFLKFGIEISHMATLTENLMEKEDFKKNRQNEFRSKWNEKRMYGQFVREMPEVEDKDLSWKWLVQGDLKVQTEAIICAAQEKVLRTNHVKKKIDKTPENPLCRMCGEKGKTVQQIICEWKKLAQHEYKRRHDNVAKLVHWKLYEKHNLMRKEN